MQIETDKRQYVLQRWLAGTCFETISITSICQQNNSRTKRVDSSEFEKTQCFYVICFVQSAKFMCVESTTSRWFSLVKQNRPN